jgi:subtilisin family serine protease
MPRTRTREERDIAAKPIRARETAATASGKAAVARTAPKLAHMRAHQHELGKRSEFVPGALMIKCAYDVVENVPDLHSAHVATVRTLTLPERVAAPFEALAREDRIKEVIPVFSRLTRGRSFSIAPATVAAAFATSVRDSENEDLRGINMLRLSPTADMDAVVRDLEKTDGIEYVHRVPRRWMAARPTPNDPLVAKQWALRTIRWYQVKSPPDVTAVKVGVLDTGVDLTHPELMNIVKSYVHDGASGIDVVGHGTHVSGIITAQMNNNVGMSGACQCDLSVWKIFTDQPDPFDGEYYVDDVMYQRALNAARNAGMRVVNLSIGGTQHSPTEEFLFRRLIDSGCVVVAAMGNEFLEGNPVEYPAAYPDVVAVGATARNNTRASFSNTGAHISLSAPGVGILSTLPREPSAARDATQTEYALWDGTSMATPHVSAAAASVVARNPNFTPAQVAEHLTNTARKVPALGGKTATSELGAGLLDLSKALS